MEQYELRPKDCNKNIQIALKYFPLENLFIRRVGSQGGGVIIDRNFDKNQELIIQCTKAGFEFGLRGVKKIFLFEFKKSPGDDYTWGKKWSLAYERVWRTKIAGSNGYGEKLNFASTGYPFPGSKYDGPDDQRLPEPEKTTLRCVNESYFTVITFAGKIPIRKTKYKMPGVCDYYEIDRARLPKNTASA